ncbi:MAG: flavin reductase family protein [Paracoccaceae bacterium]|nr:MAG: flavin reductase family protein [Paracoccaceae bacterium]
MRFDLANHDAAFGYKLMTATITPRPIAWVTTKSAAGVVNAAPYSFFNAMGHTPPTLVLGLMADPARGFKDTARNILDTGEFVVNLVPYRLAEAMNLTCIDAPPEVSEIDLAGLAVAPSTHVKPPRIAESPVSFECTSFSTLVTGPHQCIVVGHIHAIHIDDAALIDAQRGHVDTARLDLIARMGGAGAYAHAPEVFTLDRPRWADRNG